MPRCCQESQTATPASTDKLLLIPELKTLCGGIIVTENQQGYDPYQPDNDSYPYGLPGKTHLKVLLWPGLVGHLYHATQWPLPPISLQGAKSRLGWGGRRKPIILHRGCHRSLVCTQGFSGHHICRGGMFL